MPDNLDGQGGRTTTMLNTGLGDDYVKVSLTSGQDGFFVLNLMGGEYAPGPGGRDPFDMTQAWSTSILPAGWTNNSYVDASASTLPILVFGNVGNDTIIGGAAMSQDTVIAGNLAPAGNVIFGHFGRVQTVDAAGNVIATYGYGGRGDVISSRNLPAQYIYSAVLDNGGNVGNAIVMAAPFSADNAVAPGEENILIGGPGNNMLNGGPGSDLIFGHNATLMNAIAWTAGGAPLLSISNPRFETLTGAQIYTDTATTDKVNVDGTGRAFRTQSGYLPAWAGWNVKSLDVSDTTPASHYGNDYIAGGPADDMIFGEMGNNVIQGDGSIASALALGGNGLPVRGTHPNPLFNVVPASDANAPGPVYVTAVAGSNPVYAYRDKSFPLQVGVDAATGALQYETALGALHVSASFEARTDGNDYIEGGGGNDVIFGNLGQNDIIGGNSDLFSLTQPSQRPDSGSPIIFAGAGTEIARNYDALPLGTSAGDAHARNASVIVANNGDIFDLVGTNGTDTGGFLTFNYDSGQNGLTFHPGQSNGTNYYGGTQFVIPRAVRLLDYTYGGPDFNAGAAANDRGGPAEIHAESGDTQIYGGPNLDYLFGGSGNNQIISGYGGAWIAGGNGLLATTGTIDPTNSANWASGSATYAAAAPSDGTGSYTGTTGILGADGRLAMSRYGIAEPLYGVPAVPAGQTLNETIKSSVGGGALTSVINVAGALTVTADLTPFNVDPFGITGANGWAQGATYIPTAYEPQHYDDIIYGGLGNTFIHGGPGDDAISGVQALPVFWNDPVQNPYNFSTTSPGGGILGYNPNTRQFAAYSATNPRALIGGTLDGFFLNFNQNEGIDYPGTTIAYAGTKDIFGDLGNDWIVGGNSASNLFGGFGDDLLDVRRNLTLDNGANDVSDNNAYFHGTAFAGGGASTLIAGGKNDRLVDWGGNFSTFIVPFKPWGEPTVTRSPAPSDVLYLYELSAADGADNLYADYNAPSIDHVAGLDPTRNGEPYGEIGLVTHVDCSGNRSTASPTSSRPATCKSRRRRRRQGPPWPPSAETS